MNKKFLSAILFGALMVTSTGTFVSCKDYDDDITELRDELNQQKTDLSAKVTAVESTISSLQSAQSSLQSEIANAKSDAQKAALAAQEAAIAAAKADLEDVKSELQAAIEANTQDAAALKEKATAIEASMTQALGRIQTLEAFKTTTEETLKALGAADEALTASIATLDETVLEHGKKVAALEAQVKALEEYKGENQEAVDALKGKLADIEAGQLTEDMIKQIAEQVTEIAGSQLSVIEAAISKAVTFVTLYNPTYDGTNYNIIAGSSYVMDLRTTLAVEDRTFGKDEAEAALYTVANQKEFKKGERAFLTDSVLIRVSPSNAVLTPEQISFVNSELGTLDELITVEDVKPFKGMVTSRGISANGLWKVVFKLNKENYSEETYMAAAKYGYDASLSETAVRKLASINYAVAVKDVVTDTDRYVTSSYDLELGSDYAPVYTLNFKVNDTNVGQIRNRFHQAEDRTYVLNASKELLYDYAWNVNADNKIVEKDGSMMHIDANGYYEQLISGKNQKIYYSGYDQRNNHNLFSAKVGEPFTVSLNYGAEKMAGIYGFYVVYDAYRAVESAPSEINAWNSYEKEISGLNTVTTDKKIELTINAKAADGDILGFRVYAVNYDGSLVDPDGKAFYVAVGEIKETTLTTTWTPNYIATTPDTNKKSEIIPLSDELKELLADTDYRAEYYNLVFDQENNPMVDGVQGRFRAELVNENGEVESDQAKAVGIQLTMTDAAHLYKDNGTYAAYFYIKNRNKNNIIVKKVILEVTKTMPEFPAEFSAKANQLVDGVHTTVDFYTRDNWYMRYDLSQVFNGLVDVEGVDARDENYKFTCANEDITFVWGEAGDYSLILPNDQEKAFELIGGTYDVTVSYTYRGISSELDANNTHNYTVAAPAEKNFKVKLNCLEALTAEWNKKKTDGSIIKYEMVYGQDDSIDLGDWFDVKQNGEPYNFANGFAGYEEIKDVKLISNGAGVEYFNAEVNGTTINFTQIVNAKRPAADVASTLTFTLVDWFGHEVVVTLPNVVVKKEAPAPVE